MRIVVVRTERHNLKTQSSGDPRWPPLDWIHQVDDIVVVNDLKPTNPEADTLMRVSLLEGLVAVKDESHWICSSCLLTAAKAH